MSVSLEAGLLPVKTHSFDDLSQGLVSPEEIGFAELGLTSPMLAVTGVDGGVLFNNDTKNMSRRWLNRELLSPEATSTYHTLGINVLGLLSGEDFVPVGYDGPADREAKLVSAPDELYVFNTKSKLDGGAWYAIDQSPHIDVCTPNESGTVVYGVHLTTTGTGVVEAALAKKLIGISRPNFLPPDEPKQSRSFAVADMHIFVRQGAETPTGIVYPSWHHFMSAPGGRTLIECSFARASALN